MCQWAIQLLNLLTGNLDREGGVLFTDPAIDTVGTGLIGPGHHDAWRSRVRQIPEFAGELPAATMREEIETPGEGQVRALLTLAGNPVSRRPTAVRSTRAIEGLDFMAAVDIYVNETTRHADVILPPTSALERDQYDLVFHLLAVRNTARFTPAVFAEAGRRDARLGDLPRPHRADAGPGAGAGLKKRLGQRRSGSRPARPRWSPCCSRPAARA